MNALTNPERIEQELERIAHDRRSGASELAVAAVRLLALARPRAGASASAYAHALYRLSRRVSRLRRTMIPIESAVARLLYLFDRECGGTGDSADELRSVLRRVASETVAELGAIGENLARQFGKRFSDLRDPIVTSYSSRVLRVLRSLGRPHVTVCESRPLMEGRRTAKRLRASGMRVTVITDAQIGTAIPLCDGLVLGCDAIFADGSVVNKSGSYPLALVAREWRRPVVVVGDHFKITDKRRGAHESQPVSQVWRGAPAGITVRNTVFETVPASLIDFIVLENGVFKPRRIRAVWERIQATRRSP